jgi:hypothetical protein
MRLLDALNEMRRRCPYFIVLHSPCGCFGFSVEVVPPRLDPEMARITIVFQEILIVEQVDQYQPYRQASRSMDGVVTTRHLKIDAAEYRRMGGCSLRNFNCPT